MILKFMHRCLDKPMPTLAHYYILLYNNFSKYYSNNCTKIICSKKLWLNIFLLLQGWATLAVFLRSIIQNFFKLPMFCFNIII